MTKALVVDDFKPFVQFICSLLREKGEFRIFTASSGLEALQKIEELQPKLILLDLNLPDLNGIEVCRHARRLAPSAKICFLSQESSPDVVGLALRVGAQGYVHKIHALRDLSAAIHATLNGERFVSSGSAANPSPKEGEVCVDR